MVAAIAWVVSMLLFGVGGIAIAIFCVLALVDKAFDALAELLDE